MPYFSVIIPSHNRVPELVGAVQSVLRQTLTDFEIIVVDDASDCELEKICREFNDSRIVCIRNTHRMGPGASRNIGVESAKGEYISFLDSDDAYLAHKLIQVRETTTFATNSAVICHRQFRLRNRSASVRWWEVTPKRFPHEGENMADYQFVAGNWLQINSITVRADVAKATKFDSEMKIWEDTKYVVQLWNRGISFTYTTEILSVYFDDFRFDRSSLADEESLHMSMKNFLQTSGTQASVDAFEGIVQSRRVFAHRPLTACANVFRECSAGVALHRCLYHFLCSLFGQHKIRAVLSVVLDFCASRRRIPTELKDFLAHHFERKST
jgi:glycosyltransferase involved in cell wall biosynthesis